MEDTLVFEQQNIVFQVSEFNEVIANHLQLLGDVTVEGEISEIRSSQNKWLSVTIKDKDASLPAFGVLARISGWKALDIGMKVHIYGSPSFHRKTARFSLWINRIVPAGEGALKMAFERLKKQLDEEGLFDPARKRTIVEFPERVGLITAKGSQAYNDFTKVLQARMGGIKVFFYPIQVQGAGSVETILEAFRYFNSHNLNLDALVLTRGGGSLEDLQSFNDEHVARAIFSSKVPVICGVGHEGDISLADLVADSRASTPSNAAELLVREARYVMRDVDHMLQSIEKAYAEELLSRRNTVLHSLSIFNSIFQKHYKRFHSVIHDFYHATHHIEQQIDLRKRLVTQQAINMMTGISRALAIAQQQVATYERLLNSLDYKNVLNRGFSITKNAKGAIIRSVEQLEKGDRLMTQLAHGTIVSEVEQTQ